MPANLICWPDVDVDVVGPVIALVAQDVPARFIAVKPRLVPSGALIAEVLDLGRAVVAMGTSAHSPLVRPVDSGPAYLRPEWQPFFTKYTGNGAELSRAGLHIILIASAGRRSWIDGFVTLGKIAARRS
jgi:hypothetical protein